MDITKEQDLSLAVDDAGLAPRALSDDSALQNAAKGASDDVLLKRADQRTREEDSRAENLSLGSSNYLLGFIRDCPAREVEEFKQFFINLITIGDIAEAVVSVDSIPVNVIMIDPYGESGQARVCMHTTPKKHIRAVMAFIRDSLAPVGFCVSNSIVHADRIATDFGVCCTTDHVLSHRSTSRDLEGNLRATYLTPICGDLLRYILIYAPNWGSKKRAGESDRPLAVTRLTWAENETQAKGPDAQISDAQSEILSEYPMDVPTTFTARFAIGRSYTELGTFYDNRNTVCHLPSLMNMVAVEASGHDMTLTIIVPQNIDVNTITVSLGWVFLSDELIPNLHRLEVFI